MMAPHEVLNELAMSRSYKFHLIVEGETDQRLLKNSLPQSIAINIIPAGNCEAALGIAAEYQQHPAKDSLGITILIDRDYLLALNERKIPSNVILTEFRDIECIMFNTPCFDRVIEEYASTNKLSKLGISENDIKSQVISIAATVGCLRYASQKLNWNFSFKSLEYQKFISTGSFDFNKSEFIKHFNGSQTLANFGSIDSNTKLKITEKDFDTALTMAESNEHLNHPLLRARGHDLFEILCLGLKKRWGNKEAQDLSATSMEKVFRLTFPDLFKETLTFQKVLKSFQNPSAAILFTA